MVRVKYRYIGFRIETYAKIKFSSDSYSKIIYDLVTESHGIKISTYLKTLSVLEDLPLNNACIFRVPRMISKEVLESLKMCKTLNGIVVNINILGVSGSIRNAKRKTCQTLQITNKK